MKRDDVTIDLFDCDSCDPVIDKQEKPGLLDDEINDYNKRLGRRHTGFELYFAHGETVFHHAWHKNTPPEIKTSG